MEKIKSRCWVMVLYPDDPSHVECINRLNSSGYLFAGVLHNQDTWDEGENEEHEAGSPKKEHWHIVLRFQNPRWRDSIANELGIKPNYIEVCRDRDSALLYLVHEGYNNKYQYSLEEVFGPLKDNLAKLLTDDDEGSRVLTIVAMIDEMECPVTYRKVLIMACQNGLYGDFRRLGVGIKYLIDEHNGFMDYMYSNGRKPTNGAYEDAKSRATFDGFVMGHQEGLKDRLNGKRR